MDQNQRAAHMAWLVEQRQQLETDLAERVLQFERDTQLRVTSVRTTTIDTSIFGEVRPRWSLGSLSVACEV